MAHDAHCENANNHTCVCPCGGARHGAILIRGISSTDPASQEQALNWVESKRWSQLTGAAKLTGVKSSSSERRPALAGVVTELVALLIVQVQDEAQVDAVELLAHEISEEVGDEFEKHLTSDGPDHRSNRHLWCVVLATICRVYDEIGDFTQHSIDGLIDHVMRKLQDEISSERGEDIAARDILWRRSGVVSAFEIDQYDWLGTLIKKALKSIVSAMKAVGEETVVKYIRLIGAIVCPDPERHPAVVKYCIWPLLGGPFKDALAETVSTEIRSWLQNAYIAIPSPGAAGSEIRRV